MADDADPGWQAGNATRLVRVLFTPFWSRAADDHATAFLLHLSSFEPSLRLHSVQCASGSTQQTLISH